MYFIFNKHETIFCSHLKKKGYRFINIFLIGESSSRFHFFLYMKCILITVFKWVMHFALKCNPWTMTTSITYSFLWYAKCHASSHTNWFRIYILTRCAVTPMHIKIWEAPGYAITETVALTTAAMSFSALFIFNYFFLWWKW